MHYAPELFRDQIELLPGYMDKDWTRLQPGLKNIISLTILNATTPLS
jgi:hypothetical protein